MTFDSDRRCRVCKHLFHLRHLDENRDVATRDEASRRRCKDCVDCHPPEDAPVHEADRREVVPA